MVTKKILRTVFKLRRATEQEWEEVNPILDLGEPGFAYDVYGLKIGNGVTHWHDLEYISATTSEILDLVKTLSISDFSDGDDYATKEYVNEKFDDLIIDCGTSTIGV